MIKDAYEGKFQLIITKEVSRFSRNILDTISYTRELKAIGIGVRFMIDRINTMNPDAELYLSIMASIAQEESRKTSSRVVWGQTRQMEKGVVFGQSLLGYDVKNGSLTVNSDGAETVKLIFQKYAIEQVSTAEIARFLNQHGYRTYRGNTNWRSNAVIRILNNEKYVGDLIQKKTYTPDYLTHKKQSNKGEEPLICIENHHEPLVSREVWNITQERLRKNNKHTIENTGHSNRYVFSGKIKCGECGSSFVSRSKYLKNGVTQRKWRCCKAACEGVEGCDVGKLVRDDDAMHMLKTAIQSLTIDFKAVVSNISTLAIDALQIGEQSETEDRDRLCYEIARTKQKKEALMDSYFSGDVTKTDMQTMKLRYDQQIKILCDRIAEAKARQNTYKDLRSLKTIIHSEIEAILHGEAESEVFCKNMLDCLTVFKDRHMELKLKHLPQIFWFTG